jgi:NAD(P)H-hydrate repair Nnr-like enzyme with NAD(P)H-hydrate epimerase domain
MPPMAHGGDGDIAAEHAEGAVRQVDEMHQPQRHRQAHRQDEQQHPEGEPVVEDDDEVADHDTCRLAGC